MGPAGHIIEALSGAGLPVWIIAALIFVWLVAHYGPRWMEVILKDRRESRKILNEDKRKNEKHTVDIKEKLLKQDERKAKLDTKKAGVRP